jgi:hypothetical protein
MRESVFLPSVNGRLQEEHYSWMLNVSQKPVWLDPQSDLIKTWGLMGIL